MIARNASRSCSAGGRAESPDGASWLLPARMVCAALLLAACTLAPAADVAAACSAEAAAAVQRIDAAFKAGRIGEAMAAADALVLREPDCAEGHAWLALLQQAAPSRTPRVEYHLGRAFELAPDNCTVLTLIAMTRQAEMDLRGAGRWSERASGRGCRSDWLAMVEGSMDVAAGHPEQAHERLMQWHEEEPGNPLVSGMLAVTMLRFEGKLATANLIEGVSRADTTSFLTHLVCAQVYSQLLGDEERAAGEIDRALELIPQERLATWYAARYLVQLGHDDRASELLSSRASLFAGGPPLSYWMGYAYLRAARYDDALASWEEAVREAPHDPTVVAALIEIYGMAEGYPGLVSQLREAARADTSAPAADIVLAYSYLAEGGAREDSVALVYSLRASREDTLSYTPLEVLGESYRRLGRIDDAVAACRKAVRLAPLYSGVYSDLAEVYRNSGRYEEALAIFQDYMRVDPNDPWVHHNVSVSYLDLGMYADAEAESRKAIELDPDNAVARANLGAALLAQERYEEALAEFDEALKLEPDDAMALANRGTAAFYLGDVDLATSSYERAAELGLSDPELLAHLGDAYAAAGRLDDAYAAYKQAARGDPGNARLWSLVGSMCELTGRYDEAVEAHKMAVALAPEEPDYHYYLGVAYVNTGKYSLAEQQFLAEIKIAPDHARAHNNLAAIYREQRRYFRSIEEARRALELDPGYPEAYMNLGLSLAMTGKLEDGLATLREGTEAAPDSPRLWYTLASVCLASGDIGCAREALERLRPLDSELAGQLAEGIQAAAAHE